MAYPLLRIGVVGAGANTREKHIPRLQSIDGVEIVGVCNRGPASSQRVAEQFNIPKVYGHWWELTSSPDIDAVVIGTWPYLHCPVTLASLAAGKHVLCEARMAMNAREAHQMLAASQNNPHLVAQIVPSPMTLVVDRTIQKLLDEGHLGDLLAIEVRAGGEFLDPSAQLHWRQDFELSGYNVMTLGIWYEALMRWVGEATQVFAAGKTFIRTRRDQHGRLHSVRIPEHLNVLAEMACGAQASIFLSSVTGLLGSTGVWLFGSRATLHLSQGKLYSGGPGDRSMQELEIPQELKAGWRVEEEFVGAIRGQEIVRLTTFETGVKYMEFTEAVARSMAGRQAVSLPLSVLNTTI